MRTRRILRDEQTLLDAVAEVSLQLEGWGYRRDSVAEPEREPVLLAYTPPARMNPFQPLLYSRGFEHGVAPVPVKRVASLTELPWSGRLVCHLHWIGNVLAGAESEAEADDRVDGFRTVLDEVRRQGHRVVWTAHNVLPHDAAFIDHEVALRRILIDAADAVHVMTRDSARQFADHAPLPGHKVFHVPHPSYAGAYPNFATRSEARSEMGVRPGEFVFLLFGALQAYKGVEELLVAFERLAVRDLPRPTRLVVAGNAADADFATELRVWAAGRDDATVETARIPIEDVQYYYRAADVAVLPYRRVLNSGAALLALTFGVPVLVPERGGLTGLASEYGALSYPPEEENGLTDAMAAAVATDLRPHHRHIATAMEELAPPRISDAFFTGMLDMLGWARDLRRTA